MAMLARTLAVLRPSREPASEAPALQVDPESTELSSACAAITQQRQKVRPRNRHVAKTDDCSVFHANQMASQIY
jgi:hypothetical protein